MKKDFIQKLVYYIIIGIIGVVVDTLFSNIFFNFVFRPVLGNSQQALSVAGTISATLGGIAGLINNFMLNEFLVYKKQGTKAIIAQRFGKYLITIILGTFIIGKLLVFNIFFTGLGLGFTTSNLIAIAVGTIINYPINYFWTWGEFSIREKVLKKKETV